MSTIPRAARQDVPAVATALFTFAVLAWASSAGAAVRAYEAQVPLEGTTAADRNAGFAAALRAVAVKASGRRDAETNATIVAADPSRLVQRYSTTAEKLLKVGFDARALEELLQQAGLPLWPAERPVTLVDAPAADRAEAERAAERRGLPVAWSTGTAAGVQGMVGAQRARAVLTGTPTGTAFAWSFTHAGRTTEARGPLQAGIDLAADTLAARYAPASTRSSSSVPLRVGGMNDLAAYAGLLAYLDSLSLVRGVAVDALEGSVVELRLTVRGDRELLDRIVALDTKLEPAVAVEIPQAAQDATTAATTDVVSAAATDAPPAATREATGSRAVDFIYIP
jgi:hypothetical protein